jgi:hypothetical protein
MSDWRRDWRQPRVLDIRRLPHGLSALHQRWWEGLDAQGRALAHMLAAAHHPLPVSLIAALAACAEDVITRLLQRWGPLIERTDEGVRFYHRATRAFIAACVA